MHGIFACKFLAALAPAQRQRSLRWRGRTNAAARSRGCGCPAAHQGWRDKEDFVKYELLGLTFKPRTLKVEDMSILGDAQWFSQLTLLANEKVVLNVTRGIGGFGGMGIQVDGKHKLYDADKWINKFVGHPAPTQEMTITLGRLKKHVGNKFAQVSLP